MNHLKRLLAILCLLCMAFGTASAAGQQFADLSELHDPLFLAEGVEWTETSYRSENIFFEIKTYRECNSDIYVADVYVRSAECLQRAFGGGKWNNVSRKITTLAKENEAVLALTGDNCHLLKAGWVVGNGHLYRSRGNNARDLCVLYTDGTMKTYKAKVDHEQIARETEEGLIWQTFVFGPALLDENGKAYDDFSSSQVEPKNPRAVIGYYEPGHYCLVQIDGRSTASALEKKAKNKGMTLVETAQFMEKLGCTAAYNLDGGQSAAMCMNEEIISTPYRNGRSVGDVIILCEPANIVIHDAE